MSSGVRPWFCRLVDALPAPPFGAALAIAGVVAALRGLALVANQLLSDAPMQLAGARLPDFVLLPAGIAYFLVFGGWLVIEGSARDMAELQPSLCGTPDGCARAVADVALHSRRALLAAAVAGPLLPVVLHAISPGSGGPTSTVLAGGPLGFSELYDFVGQAVFWIVLGPVLLAWIIGVRRFWRCGRHGVRVDLLDLQALAPFARFGLRMALVVLAVPLLLAPAAAFGYGPARVEVLLYLGIMAVGLAALVLPSWGLHRAIQDAKAAELVRVRSALAGDRSGLRDSPLAADAERLSVVDLAVWKDRVEALREWPFDAAALRRFGLYLLIPLGSWVGAALVERLVDRAFG
jgi:hypothetical protein